MQKMKQSNHYININGELVPTEQSSFSSARKITEPDSIFESMRYQKGEIFFEEYHAKRLREGLIQCGYPAERPLHWNNLRQEIEKVVKANKVFESARIRLSVRRTDKKPEFIVESWALGKYLFNEQGLEIDLFDETKTLDEMANLKKGNHLFYVSAMNFAREHRVDDVIILNDQGRVCESTVSNIFWVKEGITYTVSLKEGPVAGVLRAYLMEKVTVKEASCSVQNLIEADEIFFTNVIRGIQPVSRFRTSTYNQTSSKIFFEKFIEPLTR